MKHTAIAIPHQGMSTSIDIYHSLTNIKDKLVAFESKVSTWAHTDLDFKKIAYDLRENVCEKLYLNNLETFPINYKFIQGGLIYQKSRSNEEFIRQFLGEFIINDLFKSPSELHNAKQGAVFTYLTQKEKGRQPYDINLYEFSKKVYASQETHYPGTTKKGPAGLIRMLS